jgi:catechol 2,3-dioxygenase-like lactoylglutathione lyase family enzyme
VTERGPAVGRIRGINHLVVVVDDMEESVRFYRDLLGFKVVRTVAYGGDPGQPWTVRKTYFFDIGSADGTLLGLFEVLRNPAANDGGTEPAMVARLWPGSTAGPVNPRKMDHLAFNVDTREQLEWFRKHLTAHGADVSEVTALNAAFHHEFVESIYVYDPSGNPIEIATFDWDNPRWENRRGPDEQTDWMQDTDPVPALRPA